MLAHCTLDTMFINDYDYMLFSTDDDDVMDGKLISNMHDWALR